MALIQEVARRVPVADIGDTGRSDPALVRMEWGAARKGTTRVKEVWWLDEAGVALDVSLSRRPALVLSEHASVVKAARERGLPARIVPQAEVEPEAAPVPPFVRERIRRARGLGEGLLVEESPGQWIWNQSVPVDRQTQATALAAASAAYVVTAESVVRAMAWACPVVAPSEILDMTGGTPGEDSLADNGSEPVEQIRRLGADLHLSGRISRAARARYEAAHSVSASADDLLVALDVVSRWCPSSLELRLYELDSRRGEPQRHRFSGMVSAIVDGGTER